MTRHAEIAGAGFAGLVAATALGRRGWSVRVHEANAELREYGAGLFLWGNGFSVLATIGVLDEVERGSHAAPYWDVVVDGERRTREAINRPGGVRTITLRRQVLYAAVLDAARAAGAEIVANSRAIGASPEGRLILADGRSLAADLVIGADGVRSQVRDSIGIPLERRKYEDGIIRVLADRGDAVGGEWEHIVDYWRVREKTLRILYVPCEPSTVYLAMMAPVQDAEATQIPVRMELWGEFFPMLRRFIDQIGERGRYDAYEATQLERWSRGRVAIVGDAASAMPPTLGQGAGFAMTNAWTLAVALDEAPTVEEALALWERRERPITDKTQREAEELAAMRTKRINVSIGDMALDSTRHRPTGTVAREQEGRP